MNDTTDSQPATLPATPARKHTHGRTGHIARLPKDIRDQINQKLLDGLPYTRILKSIGDPVKDIKETDIVTWKKGGYKDWLNELDRKESLCATRDYARELVEQKAGIPAQDAGRAIASAQLFEILLSFQPAIFKAALAEKPELYLRLVNSLARLSDGEAASGHRRALQAVLETKPANPDSPSDAQDQGFTAEQHQEIAEMLNLM